jgi:hypothetical protein
VAAFYSAVVAARKGGGLARTWPRGRRGGGSGWWSCMGMGHVAADTSPVAADPGGRPESTTTFSNYSK